MRKFLRENSLSITFLALFLAALGFQALAGYHDFNDEQDRHGDPRTSFGRYLLSSAFGSAVMENWQSEYLQFTLFILLTVWLVQRGSPESKELGKQGLESDRDQMVGEHAHSRSPRWARARGLRLWVYSNSLLLVMGVIWLGSWFGQAVTSFSQFNSERVSHQEEPLSMLDYLGSASFWEETLQNWQSEFLAVGSMTIFAVYLRQRGSPESKPVGASHDATGVEG